MPVTLHGLHVAVYLVYRGRISTARQGDTMNEAEQAFYAWFDATNRSSADYDILRLGFLAGWHAETARNREA
jgi:hypothetical protein